MKMDLHLTSYNIDLSIAKKGKSHTIGEDIIIPAIKNVFEWFWSKTLNVCWNMYC